MTDTRANAATEVKTIAEEILKGCVHNITRNIRYDYESAEAILTAFAERERMAGAEAMRPHLEWALTVIRRECVDIDSKTGSLFCDFCSGRKAHENCPFAEAAAAIRSLPAQSAPR